MMWRTKRLCRVRVLAAAGVMSPVPLGGVSSAQIGTSPKAGQVLAEKLCISCHIVGSQATSATVPADVPTFVAIANKPDQSAESIAGRIVVPHPPMPQIHLTRNEIADLAAYILSLRKQ